MPPRLYPRDSEEVFGEEGAQERTRVDDKDPRISFAPDPSPYSNFPSPWVAKNTSFAYQGTAVMTTKQNAQLSFPFPGDALSIALLYDGVGVNAKVTIEDGTMYPLKVSRAEAAVTAPLGDQRALQRKIFHLNGLSCSNHTATLALGENPNPTVQEQELYFDWFSFATVGSPSDCLKKAALGASTTTASQPASSSTSSPQTAQPVSHDHTSQYAGITVGAAIGGFILALIAVIVYRNSRGQRRRSKASFTGHGGGFHPRRAHSSSETISMPLTMSQRSTTSIMRPEHGYAPARVMPLAHDNSFGSSNSRPGNAHSIVESPSVNAVFPLQPRTPERSPFTAEDASFNIGQTLMELEPDHRQREAPHTLPPTPPLRIFPSHDSPSLSGSHALQRLPRENAPARKPIFLIKKPEPAKDARRPTTASAVERLRKEARQLDVHRPLSPFTQARPVTAGGTTSSSLSASALFRQNSDRSNETQWSKSSANSSAAAGVSSLGNAFWSKSMLDIPSATTTATTAMSERELEGEGDKGKKERDGEKGEVVKTTDSEAEMWVSKRDVRRRAHSSGGLMPPRRPPKSPHRPSTGLEPHRGMRFQPFTVS